VPHNIWSGVVAPVFLALVLDGGECSASRPSCYIAGETAPGTHFIEGWVGPRAGMDCMEKRRVLSRVLVALDAGLDWRIDLLDIHQS
jgi:hypothetical protein